MASELRVDTLKDSSGNNSVGMAYVSGGSAKAWVNFDGDAATPSARDSFNFSSVADTGTGDYDITLTNAMANTSYVVTGGCTIYGVISLDDTPTASVIDIRSYDSVGSKDYDYEMVCVNGDLA